MIRRILTHFGTNAVMGYLLYLGLTGTPWAWRLFAFLVWVLLFLSMVAAVIAIGSRTMREEPRGKSPIARYLWLRVLDRIYDTGITLTLAATGHFVIATAYLIHFFFGQVIVAALLSPEKTPAPAPEPALPAMPF